MFLYHTVPKNLVGNIIYPLNALKSVDPSLYDMQIGKYAGRKQTLLQQIPPLTCGWSDMVFLSPVHPDLIQDAMAKAGFANWKRSPAFEIGFGLLNSRNTTIWLHQRNIENQFIDYTDENIQKHSLVPERTHEYFLQCFKNDTSPLLQAGIPHVMHRGTIDISACGIV